MFCKIFKSLQVCETYLTHSQFTPSYKDTHIHKYIYIHTHSSPTPHPFNHKHLHKCSHSHMHTHKWTHSSTSHSLSNLSSLLSRICASNYFVYTYTHLHTFKQTNKIILPDCSLKKNRILF